MSNNFNRYADLFPEFEIENVKKAYKTRTPISPLHAGDTLPAFHINKKNIIATSDILKSVQGPQSITQVIDRPLVLAFHSIHWNGYGNRLLKELKDIYADIRVMGGQLLLVTTDEKQHFDEATSALQLPFASIWDQHNLIAGKAGLYSATDPIWDRISGVNEDVPTPGIYVLTPSLKIVYSAVDLWLEKSLERRDLLSAVYEASHQGSHGIAI
ncbi:redoxin domain-containing protein [Chitinophaga filiformis]|uniref:redoxin domain-containing protein n=1 Tax=Chitinophaga filiformis TaxID=104663 RepID=UPI001F4162BE|nr:redoxin domain-containing protein [Chitinophaga filiformis]MCF6402699.1 redoxin domain-containing protein [Chitinophaga filiformis]MCF6403383.1 redoxin domain-containing protein [Chitinophaga filiformis]